MNSERKITKEFLALQRDGQRPSREQLLEEREKYKQIVESYSASMYEPYVTEVAWANSNLGQICMDIGEFTEAEQALRKALDTFTSQGNNRHVAIVSVQLAQLYTQLGKQSDAAQHLERCLQAHQAEFGATSNITRASKKRLERFLKTGRIARLDPSQAE